MYTIAPHRLLIVTLAHRGWRFEPSLRQTESHRQRHRNDSNDYARGHIGHHPRAAEQSGTASVQEDDHYVISTRLESSAHDARLGTDRVRRYP